jgi:hypothetical protein
MASALAISAPMPDEVPVTTARLARRSTDREISSAEVAGPKRLTRRSVEVSPALDLMGGA